MPMLSERLLEIVDGIQCMMQFKITSEKVGKCHIGDWNTEVGVLQEAARVLAAFESAGPEVAELLAEAEACEASNPESPYWECAKGRAADLRAWVADKAARIIAEAKLAAVEGLPEAWDSRAEPLGEEGGIDAYPLGCSHGKAEGLNEASGELQAALRRESPAGGESEVTK